MSLIPVTAFPRSLLATLFLTNNIPITSLQADPRILYSAFIPDEHYPQSPTDTTKLPVLLAIHGTSRTHHRHIEAWHDFALSHRCAIVAPIFPCLLSSPVDIDGYHYLGKPPPRNSNAYDKILDSAIEVPRLYSNAKNSELRYDLLLLKLLDEISIRWPSIDTTRIFLTGFSGGAQFVHRFMYLHPERLLAVNIGAPGNVTPLDFTKPWPRGLKNIEDIFGKPVDIEKLKTLPIMVSVGAEDTVSKIAKARRVLMGNTGSGEEPQKSRVKKASDLAEQWLGVGLNVELKVVSGARHEMEKVNEVVKSFMVKQVERLWQEQIDGSC
jgi:predicted peptidase